MDRLNKLINSIKDACRAKAAQIGTYADGDGAIRITFIPQGEWRNEQPSYIPFGTDRFETVDKIDPYGNYVTNRHASLGRHIDTYALTAMKVAEMLYAMEREEQYLSGETKNERICETNGFAPYAGAACYELYSYDELSCLIIVSIAGSSELDDEAVAKSALDAMSKWCKDGPMNECGKQICTCNAPWLELEK